MALIAALTPIRQVLLTITCRQG